MKNSQPAADYFKVTNLDQGKHKYHFTLKKNFEDNIFDLPTGHVSFYLLSSQRQIKITSSLRPLRLCGEEILLSIRNRDYE